MGAEYELKFRADETVFFHIPGPWQETAMQTTYYDTPSGSLSAKRYTLRKRLENGISICTLKTPGEGNVRGEWETECDSITAAIPILCKLGCPKELKVLCGEGLIPICGARFTRKIQLLELSGCTAELALDKGVLFAGDKEIPLCEIELELKSGSREALDVYTQAFAAEHNLQPEEKSKFARALSLYKEV